MDNHILVIFLTYTTLSFMRNFTCKKRVSAADAATITEDTIQRSESVGYLNELYSVADDDKKEIINNIRIKITKGCHVII